MKIGDVSRSRRFANPARLRWYAFHRSVRFALRMMRAEQSPSILSKSEIRNPKPNSKHEIQNPETIVELVFED